MFRVNEAEFALILFLLSILLSMDDNRCINYNYVINVTVPRA
jgi:hypothetical protein